MQEVTDELKNYESTLAALHEQAANLGEQDRESPDIQNRLGSIDNRYQELLELAKLRKQRLLDALSLYKLFNEADGVETWIDEKVCVELFLLSKIEDEVILNFFSQFCNLYDMLKFFFFFGKQEKFLTTMIITDDIEEIAIMKHRFDSFEHEMNATASKVAVVNQLARQLLQIEHPGAAEVISRQNQLNGRSV